MKRSILVLIACSHLLITAKSQTRAQPKRGGGITAQDALNNALCDCFSKDKALKLECQAHLSKALVHCLQTSEKTSALFLGYLKEKGIAMEDGDAMQAAGREVGHALTESCPVVFRAMRRLQSPGQIDSLTSH